MTHKLRKWNADDERERLLPESAAPKVPKVEIARAVAQPDCRTCENLNACSPYWAERMCTNGDKYQEATKVVLWRTE